MNALRYSCIALFSLGAALAVESPAEEKPAPPAPSGEGVSEKPAGEERGRKPGGPKGDRGGKDGERGKEGRRAMMEVWKKADTDGDGSISETEFAAMERPGRLPEEKRAELFKRMDKNGDAKIGPDELPKPHPGGGLPPLEQVDLDKDGRIVFAEFQKWGFVERMPEERQKAMFARMDRDGDGALTPKDRPQRDGRDGRRDGKGGGPDGKGGRRGNPMDMVKEHDTNSDGALSFEEFRQIPWVKDKSEDEQEDLFEDRDKNKDLKLDASDFPPPAPKPEKKEEPKPEGP